MRVLVLLPPTAVAHLASALEGTATVVPARDVSHFLDSMATAVPSAMVLDPRLIPSNQIEAFVQAVRLAGVPLLAYTNLTSFAMRTLLAVSAAGVREVLIRGADDDPPSVRRAIERLRQETLGGQLLSRLAPALHAMPEALRVAVIAMVVRPDAADTPHRLASRAGMNRRSLDRWVARTGLVSARLLVAAPKLLLAYEQLRRPDTSVANVATRLGYSSPRALERQCETLLGTRPAALRDGMDPEKFVRLLADGLLLSRPAPPERSPDHAAPVSAPLNVPPDTPRDTPRDTRRDPP